MCPKTVVEIRLIGWQFQLTFFYLFCKAIKLWHQHPKRFSSRVSKRGLTHYPDKWERKGRGGERGGGGGISSPRELRDRIKRETEGFQTRRRRRDRSWKQFFGWQTGFQFQCGREFVEVWGSRHFGVAGPDMEWMESLYTTIAASCCHRAGEKTGWVERTWMSSANEMYTLQFFQVSRLSFSGVRVCSP